MSHSTAKQPRGGVVLCGGRSTRMGTDKATLRLRDEALVVRAARRLARFVDEVVVVARADQVLPPLPPGVRRVNDPTEDLGPLGGIAPGLASLDTHATFVTTCDAPLLQRPFVDAFFDALESHDAVVGEADGYLQPLAAVYANRVADTIRAFLTGGGRRPAHVLDQVATLRLSEADLRVWDPDLKSLRGCNDAVAYEALKATLEVTDPPVSVTLELYELARQRAGAARLDVVAHTVRGALAAALAQAPGLAPEVITADGLTSRWRVAIHGRKFLEDLDTPLLEGDHLVLVSALAGG